MPGATLVPGPTALLRLLPFLLVGVLLPQPAEVPGGPCLGACLPAASPLEPGADPWGVARILVAPSPAEWAPSPPRGGATRGAAADAPPARHPTSRRGLPGRASSGWRGLRLLGLPAHPANAPPGSRLLA